VGKQGGEPSGATYRKTNKENNTSSKKMKNITVDTND